ncbi:unnamed protein product [Linum trigynum]|uniref:Uncharacterized protein n=1 Tax=Linum trigynum TaxID=586398 RepID=A0AAV2CYC5_9ROSI
MRAACEWRSGRRKTPPASGDRKESERCLRVETGKKKESAACEWQPRRSRASPASGDREEGNQYRLWSESDYDFDVIIGVFNTSVCPDHRSFFGTNLGSVHSRWKGICQVEVRSIARNCIKKLIRGRFFEKGRAAEANGTNRRG